uniref:Uncharacterized protein n=1 Tax=virus sp. ctCsQ3 TaxID=2826794 RepID=A0A8S5R5W8_9VIRU|nr:MAG TPA: hypothetical protein [virus sp. ctCsQ3]
MRLIDADVFEKFIRKNCTDSLVDFWCELVRRQPTSYDVDKVVEQLEELRKECEDPLQDYDPNYFIGKAIEIVKAGGNS